MKEAIRQRALELGFDDCRFTTAQPPASAARFQYWLNTRQHGTMAYLERNAPKRVDPHLVLSGARSVICLAVSYAGSSDSSANLNQQTESPSPGLKPTLSPTAGEGGERQRATGGSMERVDGLDRDSPGNDHASRLTAHGLVARYARFDDYHNVLGERLKSLSEFLTQRGGPHTQSLWYVDTGPVLERDLAQRAGVGFIGKHTNLISRKRGNWIFLAEILTTLELQPDEPEKNRCGSC